MRFGGGDCQRGIVSFSVGYSEKVLNATGKRSYLDPISDSMQERGSG